MLTVSQKIDNLNQILSAPQLSKLNIEIPSVRTHKQADEYRSAVIESIEKQGHKYGISDNGLLQFIPSKAKSKKAPSRPSKSEKPAPKIAVEPVTADKDTVELVQSIIAATDAEGNEWSNTGAWIFSRKDQFGSDAKENRKILYKLMDKSSGGAVPEKGLNNEGEEITLRKRNGAVKWSAWEKTRRWTQYISRIFQAIENAGFEAVFPGGILVNKDEINELCKSQSSGGGETPFQTYERCVQLAAKKVEDCEKGDLAEIEALLAELNSVVAQFRKNVK